MNFRKLISAMLVALLLLTACAGPTEQLPEETAAASESLQAQTSEPGQTEQTDAATVPEESLPEETEAPGQQGTEPAQTEAPTQPPQTEAPTEAPTETPTEAPSGDAAKVDAAYALKSGESLPGTYMLSGVITSIKTAYSERYGNITVILTVPGRENRPIQCFRLEGDGVEHLAVGDSITVSGKLMNYQGTIEFDAGCDLISYTSANPTEPEETEPEQVYSNDSRDYVANYIHTYGCLPSFYVTKNQASQLYGWSGGSLDQYAPGMCIGGDRFGNYEGKLPDAPGRYWTECDIGTIGTTSRGSKRIVFSNDGLIYYTGDHYETFTLLYGEP